MYQWTWYGIVCRRLPEPKVPRLYFFSFCTSSSSEGPTLSRRAHRRSLESVLPSPWDTVRWRERRSLLVYLTCSNLRASLRVFLIVCTNAVHNVVKLKDLIFEKKLILRKFCETFILDGVFSMLFKTFLLSSFNDFSNF